MPAGFPSDERRIRQEEANDRYEWHRRFLLPFLPAAPAGLLPLNGVLPSPRELRRMERELIESIWESRRKRGDWTQ